MVTRFTPLARLKELISEAVITLGGVAMASCQVASTFQGVFLVYYVETLSLFVYKMTLCKKMYARVQAPVDP